MSPAALPALIRVSRAQSALQLAQARYWARGDEANAAQLALAQNELEKARQGRAREMRWAK
jgi:hypothetical protein